MVGRVGEAGGAETAFAHEVPDDRIDLRELLRRKRRHAAMTGDIRLTAAEILAGA
jgi:hypothetical protein